MPHQLQVAHSELTVLFYSVHWPVAETHILEEGGRGTSIATLPPTEILTVPGSSYDNQNYTHTHTPTPSLAWVSGKLYVTPVNTSRQ